MATTSVHLPKELVEGLDKLARESGRSRNRVILEACESYIRRARETWPDDFFSGKRLKRADVAMLQDSLEEWLKKIQASRRNRVVEPF